MSLNDVKKWKEFTGLDSQLKDELMKMNESELEDAFYTDVTFGTGGMRGVVGAGTNRLNIYTLRKANYGFAKYLLAQNEHPSVVIAHDNRHMHDEFTIESARTLSTLGVKVYLFKTLTPTPELSFAVRYKKATGGIVITASHNPPKYNGYKIYDDKGCQLVPELADMVINNINNAPDPFEFEPLSFDELQKSGMIEYLGDDVDDQYLQHVKSIALYPNIDKSDFKVIFTPLHGTSARLGKRLLEECGYQVFPVLEQMVPDPNFSTVKSPNPEVMSAFDMSLDYARKYKADICIATDPDADRVGLAVRLEDGDYKLLTGNQTGALLIYYIVNNKKLPENGMVYNTIVTSSLGANIAMSKGLSVFSTLTGFKFIGEQAGLIENTDKHFVFGYEESYGYVIGDFVRDKDSLQALLMCSEMACFYKKQGKNLWEVLNQVYKEYGYFLEQTVNIELEGVSGARKIQNIMNYFRTHEFKSFGDFEIFAKEDYELSKRYVDGLVSDLTLPKSNVIKYISKDNEWAVLRPSGTEPKLKIYFSVKGESSEDSQHKLEKFKESLLEVLNGVENE